MIRFVVLALLLSFASVAHAQSWLDQPGVAGTTVVEIGDARIKLPPGEWRKVATATSTFKDQGIPIVEQVFVQTSDMPAYTGRRIHAIAYVRANSAAATAWRRQQGFSPDGTCFRADIFLNDSSNVYPGQWDCFAVNHATLYWNANAPPLWQDTMDAVKDDGGLPRPTPYVQFGMASPNRSGFAVLAVYVNPGLAGFSNRTVAQWKNSEWFKENITPDHEAFLKKLAAWGEAYRPIFRSSWD